MIGSQGGWPRVNIGAQGAVHRQMLGTQSEDAANGGQDGASDGVATVAMGNDFAAFPVFLVVKRRETWVAWRRSMGEAVRRPRRVAPMSRVTSAKQRGWLSGTVQYSPGWRRKKKANHAMSIVAWPKGLGGAMAWARWRT